MTARRLPRWLALSLAIFAAGAGALYWVSRPTPQLTVASWGDTYARVQTMALFHPYTDKSHVDVIQAVYGGGLREIATQIQAGSVEWDVVDLELDDAASACRQGLLERLDDMELPPGINGQAAARDFVPGAIGPCWVASTVYSQVIAIDTGRFADAPPSRLEDFFDLAKFPGPRGLRDGPKYNLEMALIADGVPPWRVYSVLTTPDGMARALAKLDSIKPMIVWWKNMSEPPDLLANGQVAMTTTLNARVFSIDAQPKFSTLWDGELYQMDVWGIPKGDPKMKLARDFIRFATGSAPLAGEARYLPYGPARRSAIPLVGRNPETDEEMRSHLPTAPENFNRALEIDPDWWAKHGPEIEARWAKWRGSTSSP